MFRTSRRLTHQLSSPASALIALLVLLIPSASFGQRQIPPRKTGIARLDQKPAGRVKESKDIDFRPAVLYFSGGTYPISIVVADVNNDGKPDLLLVNIASNNLGVLLGNGDGTFQAVVTYASGGQSPFSVVISDVNGDGKPDVVIANQCAGANCQGGRGGLGVLLGKGDGTFQPAVTYDTGSGQSLSIAVADVNGDNKLDLAVANWAGDVGILLGRGDGTFRPVVSYA